MIEVKQENASKLKEQLYNTVKNAPNVSYVQWVVADKYGFSRTLMFTANKKTYTIRWSWNESELYFDKDSLLHFDTCKVSGTYPNNYKTNLQFYLNGRIVAVIPLEKYLTK